MTRKSTAARRVAPDEAADFLRTRAGRGLAWGAGVGGAGEHCVFGGEPALIFADEPFGDLVFDRDGAEEKRVLPISMRTEPSG